MATTFESNIFNTNDSQNTVERTGVGISSNNPTQMYQGSTESDSINKWLDRGSNLLHTGSSILNTFSEFLTNDDNIIDGDAFKSTQIESVPAYKKNQLFKYENGVLYYKDSSVNTTLVFGGIAILGYMLFKK